MLMSVEMKELTDNLTAQEKKLNELINIYESKKREIIEMLEFNDMDRLQFYDLILLHEAFDDKRKVEKEIQISKEEIKLRKLFELSETIPKGTIEYLEVFIKYWKQKHHVIRVRNGEYSYNTYKPVVTNQIRKAKDEINRLSRLSHDNNISILSDGEDA